ncbi:BRO family protein [Solidesulfovibrio sp.]
MATSIIDNPAEAGNPAMAPIATLPFNGHEVPVYNVDGQNYLAGPDIARLLGYKSVNSIVMIHKRHADELDPHSRPIKLIGRDGKSRLTRTYDEPGSYLLTMFAGTENAKPVRLWLANLPRRTRELSCSIQPPALAPSPSRLTTAKERNALTGLVNRYVGMLPGGPHQEAYKAAWRKAHEVKGIGSIEELTVEQLPRAVLLMKSLVDAPALPAAEPLALPPARRRNTLDDYKALYKDLPDSPQMWVVLITRLSEAVRRYEQEMEAIRDEATRPFRANRKSNVQTYFDAAMSPTYSLFNAARADIRSTYNLVYDALQGCREAWMLLNKG